MPNQIPRTTTRPSPAYEDAGLFKNEVCEVVVWLIPVLNKTRRGDVQVTGYVDNELEVPVLFAGRRLVQAKRLFDRMSGLRTEVMQAALREDRPPPDIDRIRLPVWINGAWRARLIEDEDGCVTRRYHLVAAQWRFEADGGKVVEQGMEPVR